MTRGVGVALVLCLALGLGPAAGAQPLRSEGVGSAALPAAPGVSARSAALEAALANAVERAAAELARGAASAPGERALREAIGPSPARFVLSYRKVSEVERARASGSGREIAVTVEAQVDRGRVSDALRRAGLVATAAPPAGVAAARLVVEPVPAWPSLAALRRRLVELGARQVQIERVEPERVVLAIEGGRSAASLVAAIVASPPPGVAVHANGDRDGAPRIRLESVTTYPAEVLAPIDTTPPKR